MLDLSETPKTGFPVLRLIPFSHCLYRTHFLWHFLIFFTEHEGFILYSKVTGMESINLKNEDMPNAPVEPFTNDTHLRNVVGLSFDYSKKRIFFSDIQRGDIQFVNFDKTNYTTIIEGE